MRSNYARPASTVPTRLRLPGHNTFTAISRKIPVIRDACETAKWQSETRRIYLSLENKGLVTIYPS